MALPLIPIFAALAAGGSLVPHAAGGLIVSSAVSSYVAGTYISTAALAAYLTGSSVIAFASIASISGSIVGASMTLVGGAGLFGTTIGATGLTGLLMSWGLIPAVPIIVPVFIAISMLYIIILGGYAAYRFRKLNKRLQSAGEGIELQFSKSEALLIERILRSVSSKTFWIKRAFLKIFFKGVR